MNRVGILCGMDRAMMHEFSRRSVGLLGNSLRFRLILPLFSDLMDANIDKEVEKDAIIITRAAVAFAAGIDERNMDVSALFEETTGVDKEFMEKLLKLPAAASICYECICYDCIEDIRKRRIQILISAVYEILSRWPESVSFTEAAGKAYSQADFEVLLREILHLYSLETRELINSFRLPLPKEPFAKAVFNTMEGVAGGVATDFGRRIFTGGKDLVWC
jgi:hypothetical protein